MTTDDRERDTHTHILDMLECPEVYDQQSVRFLGIIIGWDPSVCKSNRLHVDILRFAFIQLGHIP